MYVYLTYFECFCFDISLAAWEVDAPEVDLQSMNFNSAEGALALLSLTDSIVPASQGAAHAGMYSMQCRCGGSFILEQQARLPFGFSLRTDFKHKGTDQIQQVCGARLLPIMRMPLCL